MKYLTIVLAVLALGILSVSSVFADAGAGVSVELTTTVVGGNGGSGGYYGGGNIELYNTTSLPSVSPLLPNTSTTLPTPPTQPTYPSYGNENDGTTTSLPPIEKYGMPSIFNLAIVVGVGLLLYGFWRYSKRNETK